MSLNWMVWTVPTAIFFAVIAVIIAIMSVWQTLAPSRRLKDIADLVVHVPVDDMEVAEDIHLIIFHAIKQNIIRQLKGENYTMGFNYDQRVK